LENIQAKADLGEYRRFDIIAKNAKKS